MKNAFVLFRAFAFHCPDSSIIAYLQAKSSIFNNNVLMGLRGKLFFVVDLSKELFEHIFHGNNAYIFVLLVPYYK